MTTQIKTKLKTLFELLKPNNVLTSKLLDENDISRHLRRYYKDNGWIESIGKGAYKKPGDTLDWHAGVNALQFQLNLNIHVGGLTAMTLYGLGHYLRLSQETLYLFSLLKTRLPKWFTDYNWDIELSHKPTSFLPGSIGIKQMDVNGIIINVSTPERAILECLLLAPNNADLVECYQVFEGLVNLKPKLVSELLMTCNSVKVKRLFLYMAKKADHQWLQFIAPDKINIGSGDRMITKHGMYISDYQITVPKELAEL